MPKEIGEPVGADVSAEVLGQTAYFLPLVRLDRIMNAVEEHRIYRRIFSSEAMDAVIPAELMGLGGVSPLPVSRKHRIH